MGTYVVVTSTKPAGCPGGGSGGQVMAVRITGQPAGRLGGLVRLDTPARPTPSPPRSDGTSDAIVWYMNNGKLMGVDGDTGATVYTSSNTCSGIPHWSSPIAVKGRIVVAGNGHLCAWGIPGRAVAGAAAEGQAPQARHRQRRPHPPVEAQSLRGQAVIDVIQLSIRSAACWSTT